MADHLIEKLFDRLIIELNQSDAIVSHDGERVVLDGDVDLYYAVFRALRFGGLSLVPTERLEALEDALKPFAEVADQLGQTSSSYGKAWTLDDTECVLLSTERIDGAMHGTSADLTLEDFRKAQKLL